MTHTCDILTFINGQHSEKNKIKSQFKYKTSMPICNSSYCKANTYVHSVPVESKSSGTTHTFKKENY